MVLYMPGRYYIITIAVCSSSVLKSNAIATCKHTNACVNLSKCFSYHDAAFIPLIVLSWSTTLAMILHYQQVFYKQTEIHLVYPIYLSPEPFNSNVPVALL